MKRFERSGVLTIKDLKIPSEEQLKKGVAITECIQKIPCNPCVESCPVDAISMKDINAIPIVDYDTCIACGKCVGVCPGLAIFVVKKTNDKGLLNLPYEFLPIPKKNEKVDTFDRDGRKIGTGSVKRVRKQGKTMVVTIQIDASHLMDVRHIQVKKDNE